MMGYVVDVYMHDFLGVYLDRYEGLSHLYGRILSSVFFWNVCAAWVWYFLDGSRRLFLSLEVLSEFGLCYMW
jgi:hypothetical protein